MIREVSYLTGIILCIVYRLFLTKKKVNNLKLQPPGLPAPLEKMHTVVVDSAADSFLFG